MTARIGSGHGFPAVGRVREVESGPAARSSTQARQAGTRAAAVVRISAEARAWAAAAEAEARAAAATPEERQKVELGPVLAQPLPDFHAASITSNPRVTLEQLAERLTHVLPEE